MAIDSKQKEKIKEVLIKTIEKKLRTYARETSSMPFLVRLVQDSRKVAAYSFIHSIATSLGMSIYEQVSEVLVEASCEECFRKYDIGGVISKDQRLTIEDIISELRNGTQNANYEREMKLVLNASSKDGKSHKENRIVDLYFKRDGMEYFFEIKTVKPNIDVFTESKTKLLEWIARRRKPIRAILAFPYNPYHPKPYNRFTQQNLMEQGVDFLVGEEYWQLLSGDNTYPELLKIFDDVGKTLKNEILAKIEEVAKEKMEGI